MVDFKKSPTSKFHLKDLGNLKYFRGTEVARSPKGIVISQCHYALELLQNTGTLGAKPHSSPMDPGLKLSKDSGDLLYAPTVYRRLIGKLIYLTITRPDLSFSVNQLSQFMEHHRQPHY